MKQIVIGCEQCRDVYRGPPADAVAHGWYRMARKGRRRALALSEARSEAWSGRRWARRLDAAWKEAGDKMTKDAGPLP